MAFPPGPEATFMVPLPFAPDELREYVDLNVTPDFGPFDATVSSTPVMFPVGLEPSAENSPENVVTPNVAGLDANPAYAPFTWLFVYEVTTWASPNPNKTVLSAAMTNAVFGRTMYATAGAPRARIDASPFLISLSVPT